jgi:hypothetical protein
MPLFFAFSIATIINVKNVKIIRTIDNKFVQMVTGFVVYIVRTYRSTRNSCRENVCNSHNTVYEYVRNARETGKTGCEED